MIALHVIEGGKGGGKSPSGPPVPRTMSDLCREWGELHAAQDEVSDADQSGEIGGVECEARYDWLFDRKYAVYDLILDSTPANPCEAADSLLVILWHLEHMDGEEREFQGVHNVILGLLEMDCAS